MNGEKNMRNRKNNKLKIGVSACLIGLKFRYNGTSKFSQTLVDKLNGKADLIPVCPEVECGLPIPREPMHLEVSAKGTRLKGNESGTDETERFLRWADNKLEQLESMDLSAFIFQARSPSCGLADTKIFSPGGKREITDAGTGLFAQLLQRRFPKMLIGEEKDLDEILCSLGLDCDCGEEHHHDHCCDCGHDCDCGKKE